MAMPENLHLQHLRCETHDGLLDLCIDKPKGNVFDGALMRELEAALSHFASDTALRLVLLRAAGSHFSFGASIEEHQPDQAAGMLRQFHSLIRKIALVPVPVAVLVQGKCLGGAFEVALAATFVLCTPDASFACPEIHLGVIPPVLGVLGPQRLGGPLAERLLLTGAPLDAQAGLQAGWVSTLVSQQEPHRDAVAWYRTHLQPRSALAIRVGLKLARQPVQALCAEPLDQAEALYLQELLPSHDGNEGIAAFLARRAPLWTHS